MSSADRPEPRLVPLPDGRVLAVDDVGDPDGLAVLYLHGTPDSRLSRHPDDGLAAAAGVRLLAVDRPGCGRSTPHPGRTLGSVADDLAALARALGVERAGVLAWSAGAPYAVALAARHPGLVAAVGLAAPLVPLEAYADAGIADAAGPGRVMFARMASVMDPDEVAAEVAPFLLPTPPTAAGVTLQLDAELEGEPARAADLAAVPGGRDRLVAATVEAVAGGPEGVLQDVATQARTADVDLAAATAPAVVWVGAGDTAAPPAFGHWWGRELGVPVHVLDGAGHTLLLPHWSSVLATLVDLAG